MTRLAGSSGIWVCTQGTRWDLPAPEAPRTGTTRTPLLAGRVRNSLSSADSLIRARSEGAELPGVSRRMSSGACVARNTLSLGLTASVAMVLSTLSVLQQVKPLNSGMLALLHGDVRDRTHAGAVEIGQQDRVG